jgi:hypothetical protein
MKTRVSKYGGIGARIRQGRVAFLLLILAILSSVAVAQAQPRPTPAAAPAAPSRLAPADRLPAGCSAVMVVDVARLVDSPWGKQNDLRGKLNARYGGRPLPVPGNAKRLAVGGKLIPVGLESMWRAAVIELPAAPRMEPMIQAQGGYLDKVGGKPAAWSPKDAFYVALDGDSLGVYQPADRRQVLSWASSPVAAPLPPYVARALSAIPPEVVAVFAMDLQESISPAAISYALGMGELPSLESMETDKLLPALASVTGTTITVRPAGENLEAEWAIDFAQDVSPLGAFANAVVIDALKSAGAYEPEAEQWSFKAEGKRFVGKRAINEESFSRLVSLLAPASNGVADAAVTSDGDAQPAAARATSVAEASQAYYHSVAKCIDVVGSRASASQSGTSLTAQARRIQQLPVLDVDPALVEWAGTVAESLDRAAHEITIGSQRAQAAAAAVAAPAASGAGNYGSASTPESRAAFRNASNQRRQAAQTERAAASQKALDVLNTIPESRAKVRVDMSQKYRVEF